MQNMQLAKNVITARSIKASLVLLLAVIWILTHLFGGRGAYMQIGALVGTIMVGLTILGRSFVLFLIGLLLFGVVANYLWWVHGPGKAGFVEVKPFPFIDPSVFDAFGLAAGDPRRPRCARLPVARDDLLERRIGDKEIGEAARRILVRAGEFGRRRRAARLR